MSDLHEIAKEAVQSAATEVTRPVIKMSKRRVYIDSREEAPDGAQVHEGARGGLYYESEEAEGAAGEEDGGAGGAPDADADEGGSGERQAVPLGSGQYVEVTEYDSFDRDTWPDEGQKVLVNDHALEVLSGGGPFVGPDGKDYLRVDWQGEEMTIQDTAVDGVVEREYNVGEYEPETEWGLRFADAMKNEEADFSDQLNVREIQHHASDVEDTTILIDAITSEKEGRGSEAAIRAMEGRCRALGVDPDKFFEEPEAGGDSVFSGEEYSSWREDYSPDSAKSTTALREMSDVEPGVSADNMAVQEIEGSEADAFVSQYASGVLEGAPGGGLRTHYRDEIICLGHFAREADAEGSVVPVSHDEENGEWTAVKEFGAEMEAAEVSNMEPEWAENVDADEALDKFGVMALAGAGDLHSNNVMLSEDGDLGFHDLDHAGATWGSGGWGGPAERGGETLAQIMAHRDYETLPDDFQEKVDRDEYEDMSLGDRRWELSGKWEDVIEERAFKRAEELVEESPLTIDELFYTPDDSYENEQKYQNSLIKDNLEYAYEQATGEEVSL